MILGLINTTTQSDKSLKAVEGRNPKSELDMQLIGSSPDLDLDLSIELGLNLTEPSSSC